MNNTLSAAFATTLFSIFAFAAAAQSSNGGSGSEQVYLTDPDGTPYCNAITINWTGSTFADTDSLEYCDNPWSYAVGVGEGIAGTLDGIGPAVDMSDTVGPYFIHNNEAVDVTYSLPITNGGTWTEWITWNGVRSTFFLRGNYWFGLPRHVPSEQKSLQEATSAAIEKATKAGEQN